jgi:hypothetical protein
MKKVFVIASVGMLMFATSCKKSYTCTFDDGTVLTYDKMGKTSATAQESACTLAGGKWSKK